MRTCRVCSNSMATQTMRVGEDVLEVSTCSRCDVREWRRGEREVDLREVLDLTSADAARRRPRAGR